MQETEKPSSPCGTNLFSFHLPNTVNFPDNAIVKRSSALWVIPKCHEGHPTFPPKCALAKTPLYFILIYIQQDATLHSLFYLETARHVSGGTSTHHQEREQTVSTTSGIYYTVTAICRYRGGVGTGLSVLCQHSTLKPVPTLPR